MSGNQKRILVVDDEAKLVEVVKSYLEHEGYEVLEAYNGKDALELVEKSSPHLIILDLMLPDIKGEEVCRILREKSRIPVIMLTAKVDEEDILKGLDIGGDDYVTKPFSPKQLVARVKAVLRRTYDEQENLSNILSFNNEDLVIDNLSYNVKKSGRNVGLTPNEFKILSALVSYPKKTFTRDELITLALGDDFEGFDRTIDTHIKNLRQKIETDPKSPQYVITVHGVGYRFGGE
ncbi:MAG: response regulator transcription factor [Bacillota bacterium]|nr:response regulator transcription factor [Bacillota bacterium]